MKPNYKSTVARLLVQSLAAILATPFITEASAQEIASDSVYVANATFVMIGDTVIITYDLIAPPETQFDVTLVLRKASEPDFAITPSSITGSVGRVRGGGYKTVIWNYRKDVPATLKYGQDYWFEITATSIEEGSSLKWWHYAAGGIGALAGVFILSGGGDAGNPVSDALPDPPRIRPTQ